MGQTRRTPTKSHGISHPRHTGGHATRTKVSYVNQMTQSIHHREISLAITTAVSDATLSGTESGQAE